MLKNFDIHFVALSRAVVGTLNFATEWGSMEAFWLKSRLIPQRILM